MKINASRGSKSTFVGEFSNRTFDGEGVSFLLNNEERFPDKENETDLEIVNVF